MYVFAFCCWNILAKTEQGTQLMSLPYASATVARNSPWQSIIITTSGARLSWPNTVVHVCCFVVLIFHIAIEKTKICSGHLLMCKTPSMHCFKEQCHTNILPCISKFFESISDERFFLQLNPVSPLNCAQAKCPFFSITRSTLEVICIFVACCSSFWVN